MREAWILGLIAMSVSGCAYGGGGGNDAGIRLMDSGRPLDGGPPDGGPMGTDSGVRVDSGGGTCGDTPCRLVSPQCGCPAGQGCYLSGTSRVCGVSGTETEGQACTGATACQAGNLCIGSGTSGFCARLCAGDADCTGGPGSLCLTQLDDGMGGAIPGVALCTAHCTPTNGRGCPATMGCAVFQESTGAMRTFTSCRPAGVGTAGARCTDEEDCAPGHFCADPGTGNECIRVCTVPSGSECGGGTCRSFADGGLIIGSVEYGYCQ